MAAEKRSEKLPEYERPPVVEVVCGIAFRSINSLMAPHLGLLWERFKKDYPDCDEVAPLLRQPDMPGEIAMIEAQLVDTPPLARIWFEEPRKNRLIQVQRDRFLHNWKKVRPDDEYPRYRSVINSFRDRLADFRDFLRTELYAEVQLEQQEMSYINHIPVGQGWNDVSEIGRVFPDVMCQPRPAGSLAVSSVNWTASFVLPEDAGRLTVTVRNALRRSNKDPILLCDLTARGPAKGNDEGQMWDWFERTHMAIVQTFEELTNREVQKEYWGRKS